MARHADQRGFFGRNWCTTEFVQHGLSGSLRQCNISYNVKRGTLRGLHYQHPPHAEDKLVHCLTGAIYDVVVDLRPESDTYSRWLAVELTADNGRMIYIPQGLAHGFITLADDTRVGYFITSDFTPSAQAGLRYDDPAFAIDWPIPVSVISERDRHWPNHVS